MKSIYFTEAHEMFRETVRQFLEKEVAPVADEWERQKRIPREIWEKMGKEGLLGIPFPAAYGGMEADFFFSVAFLEELPRSRMGGFVASVGVHEYMAAEYLHKFGNEPQKQAYLVPAIQGKKIGALAITEPNAGSDVAAIRTRAVRKGNYYVLNGAKTFITNGLYGDFIVLAAKTDPDAGASGISLFIVDREAPGLSARNLDKIGWHASDTAELTLEDVRIPASRLIGRENEGFYYIMECFQLERLVAAITAVGGAQQCLNITLKYIHEREAFSRPLAKFQVIRHELAEMEAELEAARQLTYHVCWMHQQNIPAIRECSMAKLITTELAVKIADRCLQFFGGYGYMDEYLISRIYRDARVGTIVGGTSEIMREIIARILVDGQEYRPKREPSAEANAGEQAPAPKSEPAVKQKEPCPKTAREIVLSLPQRFRPEKAGKFQTMAHFDISGPQGGQFTVIIENGKCRVKEGLLGEPCCVLKASDKTYTRVELGKLNAQTAVMTGKLKVSNLAEMMRFIKLFRPLKDL